MLFESIKKGAPAFTASGQSMESFNTLVGVMANAGIKGAESGTMLRNVMLRLAKPTKEASDVLTGLGIKTQDSQGNFLDVIDILAQFENATKNMGTAQKSAALSTVFGARSITGVNILLSEGTNKLRGYREQLLGASGESKKMADTMRGSILNQLNILKSSLIELGFKFIEAFDKQGRGGLKSLIKAVQEFDPTFIIEGLRIMFKVLSVMFQILKPFLPIIIGIIVAWRAYKVVAALATAAQIALNIAMSANPIGLIIIAIGTLIGLVYIMIKNWNEFGAAMTLAFGPFGQVIAYTKTLYDRWGEVKNAFGTEGIISGLKALGKTILDSVLYPLQQVLEIIAKIPGVGRLARAGAEKIQGFREGALGAKTETPIGYASPESQKIGGGTTTRGNVDINVTGRKEYVTVDQSGKMPLGTSLNLGLQ